MFVSQWLDTCAQIGVGIQERTEMFMSVHTTICLPFLFCVLLRREHAQVAETNSPEQRRLSISLDSKAVQCNNKITFMPLKADVIHIDIGSQADWINWKFVKTNCCLKEKKTIQQNG